MLGRPHHWPLTQDDLRCSDVAQDSPPLEMLRQAFPWRGRRARRVIWRPFCGLGATPIPFEMASFERRAVETRVCLAFLAEAQHEDAEGTLFCDLTA